MFYVTKDELPTKISDLENDSDFATKDEIPKLVSELENDSGYLTSNDLSDFALKEEIPTKISELENDSNFLTEHQTLKTINGESIIGEGDLEIDSCKVNDVLVNGISVVEDKIAKIDLSNLDSTMGRDFTTNITVGHLESGTKINKTDKVADILYRILYKIEDVVKTTVDILYGAADKIPVNGIENLDWSGNILEQNPSELLTNGLTQNLKTGNLETEDGQYSVFALSKNCETPIKLVKWAHNDMREYGFSFSSIETDEYYIYYLLDPPTYSEDVGGIDYYFTFEEV